MKHTLTNTLLTIVFFIALSTCSYGQEYISNIKVFGMEDGLSHFEVHSMYQDSRGFLWVGTRHGLNRFDSHEFQKWSKNKNGLTYDKVLSMKEDNEGYLWLLVTHPWSNVAMDINFINIKTLKVSSFKERFPNVDIPIDELTWIPQHTVQQILLPSVFKPITYHYNNTKGFQTLPFYRYGAYTFSQKPNDETFYFLSKETYLRLNLKGEVIDSISLNLKGEGRHLALNIDENNERLHYHSSIGVFKIINKKIQIVPFKDIEILKKYKFYPHEYLYSFAHRPSDNTFWFSFPDIGIIVLHPEKGLIHEFKNSLKGIEEIYIDKFGIAWMISMDGLVRVSLQENKFQHHLSSNLSTTQKLQLSFNYTIPTRQIIKHQNKFHVATDFGLFKLNKEAMPDEIISEDHALSILPLDSNKIAYGFRNEIFIYENNKLLHHHFYPMGPYWSMYQDKYNKIWIGSETNIAILKNLSTPPITFKNYKDFPLFPKATFYQFYEKKANEIWIASTKGIFVLDIEQEKIVDHFWSQAKGKKHLPNDIIHHIFCDKDGVYWLSTTEGLVKWNSETGESSILNIQNGLPNDVIYACYEDDFKHLWLSSNYGIIQVNKETFQTNHYLPKDGLTHHEFNRTSHFQDKDGTIYFGGINGITSFHPKDFYNNPKEKVLPLEIVRFQQFNNNSQLLVDKTMELFKENKIVVSSSDLFFTIDFALLDYLQDNQPMYGYKIEGFDKDWNYIRNNSLRINQLPYGKYTLKIKGQTHKGTFSESTIEIPIIVKTPFYLTTWFILLCVIFLSASIYSIYAWRTKQLITQNQQLEIQVQHRTKQLQEDKLIIEQQAIQLQKLDELKSRFFVNVSHELRTPLTLIISPIQVLLKKNHRFDKQELGLLSTVEHNAFKLLHLTEEVLQLSRLESEQQKLHEEEVFFYNYFLQIFNSFQSLAISKDIQYRVDYQIDKAFIFLIDKNIFEHIITNLISNAFKYTSQNGFITIVVRNIDNQILIEVTDTGIGIPAEDLPYIFDRYYQTKNAEKWTDGTGIGLALAKELTNLLNGKLLVQSEYQKGSTFSLFIPMKKIKTASSTVSFVFSEKNQLPLSHLSSPELTFDKNRPTLLVVEDNAELRYFLAQMLNEYYNIVLVNNGLEALEELSQNNFQLIISDIMMPKMDGFQLLEQLKNHPKWIRIPIILLSAKTDISDKIKALTIGIDDYVTKPFEIEELLARIKNSINNAAARKRIDTDEENTSILALDKKPVPIDITWLNEVNEIIEKEITNSVFNIDSLAQQAAMSKRQFYRKIKSSTGLTPNKYVREYKLQKARTLLEKRHVTTLAETAYAIGFDTPHYFATLFEERFGKKPQSYLRQH